MEEKEWRREVSNYIEEYRNRLIDQQLVSGFKAMDLGTDRLLKDCELYITLFGLLIAGLSFLYNYLSGNCVKYIFIFDIILIFLGIIRSFRLRQMMSRSVESYHNSRTDILTNEINELDFDPPQDPDLLFSKRLDESKRLLDVRRDKITIEMKKYKSIENKYFKQKKFISLIYIISFLIFLVILFI